MYAPIIGANEEYEGHIPVMTVEGTLSRVEKLQTAYDELRTDLLEEVSLVDTRIIKPAMEAKDYIQPLKKVIKKRGDRKVGSWSLVWRTELMRAAGFREVSGPCGHWHEENEEV